MAAKQCPGHAGPGEREQQRMAEGIERQGERGADEAMTSGWLARASRSGSQRPRIPTSGTASRWRARRHQQVADPKHEKHADRYPGAELLEASAAPAGRPRQRDAQPDQRDYRAMAERKNSPDQRDMPGRTRALERVMPSIATR